MAPYIRTGMYFAGTVAVLGLFLSQFDNYLAIFGTSQWERGIGLFVLTALCGTTAAAGAKTGGAGLELSRPVVIGAACGFVFATAFFAWGLWGRSWAVYVLVLWFVLGPDLISASLVRRYGKYGKGIGDW